MLVSHIRTRPLLVVFAVIASVIATGVFVAVHTSQTDAQTTACTYYVATTGNDSSNPGTQGSPWRTIGHAISVARAGNTVCVRGGRYHEQPDFDGAGTAAQPIVFRAYQGETPIIDGVVDNSLYVFGTGGSYYVLDGFTIENQDLMNELWTKRYWVEFGGHHNTLRNLTMDVAGDVHDNWSNRGIQGRGIVVTGPHNTLENSYIRGFDMGVVITGNAPRYTIIRNNTIKDCAWSNIVNQPTHSTGHSRELQRTLIEGNTLSGSIGEDNVQFECDAGGGAIVGGDMDGQQHPACPDTVTDWNRGVIIRGNLMSDAGENAVDLKGAGLVFIDYNLIWNIHGDDDGILGASHDEGTGGAVTTNWNNKERFTTVRYNTIWDTQHAADPGEGDQYYNNTFLNNRRNWQGPNQTGAQHVAISGYSMPSVARGIMNNIMLDQDGGRMINWNSYDSKLTIDNNIYFNRSLAEIPNFRFSGDDLVGLGAWQTRLSTAGFTDPEKNSQMTDPKLKNVPTFPVGYSASWDFSLSAGSPAIDTGRTVTKATNSGSGSTNLTVQNARFFTDGMGITDGDLIKIGSAGPVRIAAIDYDTNSITLAEPRTWGSSAGVHLDYNGSAPDIGAFEYGGVSAPQCSDGLDNDGDGKIDFPADPGCDSASDTDETDAVTGDTTKPSQPVLSVSPAETSGAFTVFWTASQDPESGIDHYEVLRAPEGTNCTNATKTGCVWSTVQANIPPTTLSLQDTPAVGTYWYGVHVTNGVGLWNTETAPKKGIRTTGTILDDSDPTPVTLTVSPTPTTGSFALSWTAASDPQSGIARYEVWRAPDVNATSGVWAKVKDVAATSLSTTDTPSAGTYWYGVHAVNGGTPSRYSVEVAPKRVTRTVSSGDTEAPVVSVTAPIAGASLPAGTVTVTARATDNVGVTKVEFFRDGTLIGTKTAAVGSATYSLSWNAATLSGARTLTVKAYDAAGNATVSAPITITLTGVIRSFSPILFDDALSSEWRRASWYANASFTNTVPVNLGNYSVKMTMTRADGAFSLRKNGDEVPAGAFSSLEFYVYGEGTTLPLQVFLNNVAGSVFPKVPVGSTAVGSWQKVTVPLPTLNPQGLPFNRVSILVPGATGTLYLDNISFAGGGTGDTTVPTVVLQSPTNGASVSGIVTVTAHATDNIGVTRVQFFRGGTTLIGTDTSADASSNFSVSWNTAGLSGGQTLSATAFDAANNSASSLSVSVTVAGTAGGDNDAPSQVVMNDIVPPITAGSFNLSWTAATDAKTGIARYELWRTPDQGGSPNGATWVKVKDVPASSLSTTDAPTIGVWWYGIHAIDGAGNWSKELTPKKGTRTDSTAPSKVTVTVMPAPPAQTTGNFTVSWTAATDAGSGVARYELWRAPDASGAPGSWAKVKDLSASTLSTTDTPAVGTWWYGVHAIDGAGNWSTENAAKSGVRTSGGGVVSNFPVLDGIYLNKDARKPYLTDFLIAYGDWFWPSGTVFNTRTNTPAPNESYVRTRARESVGRSYNDIVQVDIEHWMVDLRYNAKSVVDQSIGYYLDVLSWMKDEEPGLKLGYFSVPLYETQYGSYGNYKTYGKPYNPEASPDLLAEWRGLNDYLQPITDASDVLYPALYAMTLDQDAWVKFAQLTIQEFKRVAKGKPIYPIIWPEVYDQYIDGAGDLIGYDFWKLQLQTIKDAGVDGVIIWAPSGFNWNPNDGWWTATKEFVSGMDSDSTAPSKVTVTVTPAPPAQTTGNFTVSWTAATDAGSGIARYELWRAPDASGAPGSWAKVKDLSASTLSTTDTPAVGTWWYGVHAIDGAGNWSTENAAKSGVRTSGGGGGAVSCTFYASPSGSNGNPGTKTSPWNLSQANASLRAGQTVCLMPGTYVGIIQPANSGTDRAPITYTSDGTGEAIVQGPGGQQGSVFIGCETNGSDVDCWSNPRSYIVIDGLTIKYPITKTGSANRFGYINIGNANSQYNTIRNCRIIRDGDYIQAYNDNILQVGIQQGDAKHTLIENNYIRGMWIGIWVTPQNAPPIYTVIRGNTITELGSSGIDIQAPGYGSDALQGNLVENNTLSHGYNEDGIQFEPNYNIPGPPAYRPPTNRGTIVRNNVIYDFAENGIDMKGGRSLVIEGNIFYSQHGDDDGLAGGGDNQGGFGGIIRGGKESATDIIIRRNVFYDNYGAIDFFAGDSQTHNENWKLYNNTIVGNNRDWNGPARTYPVGPGVQLYSGVGEAIINNIIGGHNYGETLIVFPNLVDSVLGHNLYYDPQGVEFWQTSGSKYTFPQWVSVSGEEGSREANPLFVNATVRPVGSHTDLDFSLQGSSPAINAGAQLTKTVSAGSGTSLRVLDAGFFMDGFGVTEGDEIQIASNGARARITRVDYGSDTLTLDHSISWGSSDGVSLPYNGSAPDIGAYEY